MKADSRGRGRPDKLDQFKGEILRIKAAHPKLKSPAIREELRLKLFDNLKRVYPDWPDEQLQTEADIQLPGKDSIRKFIKQASGVENTEGFKELAQPWHLGLLRGYLHLSAEAVTHILEAQEAMRSIFPDDSPQRDTERLSVRQALWVARLYDVVARRLETDAFYKEHWPDIKPGDHRVLFSVASKYADYELLSDLTGTPCDTSEFDAVLSKGIWQFFTFYREQNRQSLKDRPILDPEGHRQPHKSDVKAPAFFVFDPDCPECIKQEANGRLFDLRMELARKGVFEKQKAKGKAMLVPGEPVIAGEKGVKPIDIQKRAGGQAK